MEVFSKSKMPQATYLRIASDLHLEGNFGQKMSRIERKFLPYDPRDSESILVLAGDISSSLTQLVDFLKFIDHRFLRIIYVPGNHEYYHQDMLDWDAHAKEAITLASPKTSAAIGDVIVIDLPEVKFIAGTLWADGGKHPLDQMAVQNGLYDFSLIKYGSRNYTVDDMQRIHRRQKADIEDFLDVNCGAKPTIVVTHHLPSEQLAHPRFGTSINGGFCSDCDFMMVNGHPNLWIHGHTHDTIDTNIYGTRIICNPHGYSRETRASEHNRYDVKIVEISSL